MGYALYAIEVSQDASARPQLLMRGSDDPWTFTSYDAAERVVRTGLADMPHARVVGLGVVRRFPWA
jgi:hypothetical protein